MARSEETALEVEAKRRVISHLRGCDVWAFGDDGAALRHVFLPLNLSREDDFESTGASTGVGSRVRRPHVFRKVSETHTNAFCSMW